MKRKAWSCADVLRLRRLYADKSNPELAVIFGRSDSAIQQKASKLGLSKSPEVVARYRLKPGNVTWNKRLRNSTGLHPKCREHWFRKGQQCGAAHRNWRPLGSELIDKDGTVLRKVSDTGQRRKDWRPVHVLVWESAHGPVPHGHIVVFRIGTKTSDVAKITLDRLELVTRAENMRRNSRHNRYPPELNALMQLRGALNRKIRNREQPTA